MKYRKIIMLSWFVLSRTMLNAQLQATTDNGNTTNNLIQITGFERIPTNGSGMELYGGNRAVLQGLNRNTGTGIPLSLNPTNANIHMVENGGNVGIATTNPTDLLQLGIANNVNNYKLAIPGVYNFETVKLGQYANGAGGLEFVNHSGVNASYGIRMLVNIDQVKGLQFQYAQPQTTYNALSYTTGMFMDLEGKIGIGTINPSSKLDIDGNISIRGSQPISFTSNGNGVFNVSMIYHDVSHGFLIERARIADNNTAAPESFEINKRGGGLPAFLIDGNDNIGIGTGAPTQKLSVNGTVLAKKVKVSQSATDWPDYVFDSSYQLPSLDSVSTFIQTNKHLPDMPSAATVEKDGHDLGEVQKMLLKKMEEMTLYMIEMKKENELMKKEIEQLKGKK